MRRMCQRWCSRKAQQAISKELGKLGGNNSQASGNLLKGTAWATTNWGVVGTFGCLWGCGRENPGSHTAPGAGTKCLNISISGSSHLLSWVTAKIYHRAFALFGPSAHWKAQIGKNPKHRLPCCLACRTFRQDNPETSSTMGSWYVHFMSTCGVDRQDSFGGFDMPDSTE